jgi:hypothetical protein
VTDVPDGLTLRRNRDLTGRERDPWTRRILLGLVVVFLAAALANLFGQRPQTSSAQAPEARLTVYAPERLRAGLIFMARFHISAYRDIKRATLVLDPGWLESITLNTVEPSPVGESSRNGRLALDFGHLARGNQLIAFLEFQVNPTNVGHRTENVELADRERTLVHIDRSVTIFP